jgi:hypothetical protein
MELNRPVTVFLSARGRETLELVAGVSRESEAASFYAFQTDESGLCVSVRKEDGEHSLLIRWDCILAVDVPVGGTALLESAV